MNPSPQELKEMVEEIDVDGSGSIDFDEFRLMMVKQLEAEQEDKIPERPEKELADAFRLFDTKLDSKIDWVIDYDEFINMMKCVPVSQ